MGDWQQPDLADLKHFGAAAATSGGVELYHIPGITPEAPTVEAAFGGGRIGEPIVYGERERRAVYEELNGIGSSPTSTSSSWLPARIPRPNPPGWPGQSRARP